jgi:hypothetical protein
MERFRMNLHTLLCNVERTKNILVDVGYGHRREHLSLRVIEMRTKNPEPDLRRSSPRQAALVR